MLKMLVCLITGQRVWRNKDFDIPVVFMKSAGIVGGREYAEVVYEGKVSFVPMDELHYK